MSYDELVSAVEIDGGVKRLHMWTIKSYAAPNRDRLSAALSKEITEELNSRGIVTLPTVLPTDERDSAILITASSALGEAVKLATVAVLTSRLNVAMQPETPRKFKKLTRQVG
jgi:hypothetical protein